MGETAGPELSASDHVVRGTLSKASIMDRGMRHLPRITNKLGSEVCLYRWSTRNHLNHDWGGLGWFR